jgi:hypothetical protein
MPSVVLHPRLLKTPNAAKYLNVSQWKIRQLAHRGAVAHMSGSTPTARSGSTATTSTAKGRGSLTGAPSEAAPKEHPSPVLMARASLCVVLKTQNGFSQHHDGGGKHPAEAFICRLWSSPDPSPIGRYLRFRVSLSSGV